MAAAAWAHIKLYLSLDFGRYWLIQAKLIDCRLMLGLRGVPD